MTAHNSDWLLGKDSTIKTKVLPLSSEPITTKMVSSNPVHGEVYLIQHYVIKFVSYLRQVGGFLRVLRCPPPKKLITTILLKYFFKMALSTINLNKKRWGLTSFMDKYHWCKIVLPSRLTKNMLKIANP